MPEVETTYDQDVAVIISDYAKAMSRHIILPMLDTPDFKAFYIKDPKQGRMMSTLLVFTPEGIVIQGDLTPSINGNVSCFGYGLSWFRGASSQSYLAEKFRLERKFQHKLAKKHIQKIIDDEHTTHSVKTKLIDLFDEIEDLSGDECARKFLDIIPDYGGPPGFDLDPRELGLLVAIQHKFSELYDEYEKNPNPTVIHKTWKFLKSVKSEFEDWKSKR